MMDAQSNAARQRAHWDRVLDIDNVGRGRTSAARLLRELAFARTPDTEPLWRAVGSRANPLVVDLGGGLGTHAVALAREGHRVVVADVSGERLRALRAALAEIGLLNRVTLVQTSAERLALRAGVADVLWTRSVLIHTELSEAMAEIARCLAREGTAVLCEPTTGNPFANLYRRFLGPREWGTLTTFFSPSRVEMVVHALSDARVESFHILGFLAFFWQFSLRSPLMFRLSLGVLWPLDRLIMRLWPGARRFAWFAVMTGRGTKR
jgi:SAM-dependent methyltransferase